MTNFYTADPALARLLERHVPTAERELLEPLLHRLGADAAERIDPLAELADKNPPTLKPYDKNGERVNEVVYHPAYAQLGDILFGEYGMSAVSHRALHGWSGPLPHLPKYLMTYLYVQAEFGMACPISMTDTAARTLRMYGGDEPEIAEAVRRLTSTDGDRFTGAMFMTELQGGTDIAQTETVAEPDGDRWKLYGRKWFASNAAADITLVLARFPGGEAGTTRGVGLFMMPRRKPDGSLNDYRIERLKDKLGTRSMASGEVTLEGAYAVQVGSLERGFRQMTEMVNMSRLSNAVRAVSLMRRGLYESVQHARNRVVFGRRLIDQPLMRLDLLRLTVDVESGLGLVFYCAQQLQRADAGDDAAQSLVRILTPLAKHYLCKRARVATGEAMEIRGGNGYIEDFVHPRLVRDAHLGSIWEGASNVIALDVLRSMRKVGAHKILLDDLRVRLDALTDPALDELAERLAIRIRTVDARAEQVLVADPDSAEVLMSGLADDLATTVMAVLLAEQAQYEITEHGDHRAAQVAEAFRQLVLDHDRGVAPAAIPLVPAIVGGEAIPTPPGPAVLPGPATEPSDVAE